MIVIETEKSASLGAITPIVDRTGQDPVAALRTAQNLPLPQTRFQKHVRASNGSSPLQLPPKQIEPWCVCTPTAQPSRAQLQSSTSTAPVESVPNSPSIRLSDSNPGSQHPAETTCRMDAIRCFLTGPRRRRERIKLAYTCHDKHDAAPSTFHLPTYLPNR
jgi:hypothetical protein